VTALLSHDARLSIHDRTLFHAPLADHFVFTPPAAKATLGRQEAPEVFSTLVLIC